VRHQAGNAAGVRRGLLQIMEDTLLQDDEARRLHRERRQRQRARLAGGRRHLRGLILAEHGDIQIRYM
jgi:hypothetical protein